MQEHYWGKAVVDHWYSKGSQMSAKEYISIMAKGINHNKKPQRIELLSDIHNWLISNETDTESSKVAEKLESVYKVGLESK